MKLALPVSQIRCCQQSQASQLTACLRLPTTLLHAMQRSDILILFKAFDTREENSKMNGA